MKKRFLFCISITLIIIGYIILSYLFKHGIECPLYQITGLYCFLCGGTRSTWELLSFNIQNAYSYNALYILLLPYLILKYIEICYKYIRKNEFKITVDMIFLLITAFIFMVIRNFFIPSLQPK